MLARPTAGCGEGDQRASPCVSLALHLQAAEPAQHTPEHRQEAGHGAAPQASKKREAVHLVIRKV